MAHNTSYRQTSIILDGNRHHETGAGGVVVDTTKYKGVASVVFAYGKIHYRVAGDLDTEDTGTWTPKLETADDTSFNTNKADVTTFTAVTIDSSAHEGTAGVQAKAVDLQACRRYVRMYYTVSTDTASMALPVAATLNAIESY